MPNSSTIRRQAKRFKETGSAKNRNVNRRRHVLTEKTEVSVSFVRKAAILLKLKPYKIPIVHA